MYCFFSHFHCSLVYLVLNAFQIITHRHCWVQVEMMSFWWVHIEFDKEILLLKINLEKVGHQIFSLVYTPLNINCSLFDIPSPVTCASMSSILLLKGKEITVTTTTTHTQLHASFRSVMGARLPTSDVAHVNLTKVMNSFHLYPVSLSPPFSLTIANLFSSFPFLS